jgi:solute carrier family 35 protein E3
MSSQTNSVSDQLENDATLLVGGKDLSPTQQSSLLSSLADVLKLDEDNMINALLIALNIVASTSVVIINKWIFNQDKFQFATLLTVIHFACTYLALEVAANQNLFKKKRIAPTTMAPLCTAFCGFVLLTNLSLQFNSVSFYQCAKILTTPCIAAMQYYLYHTVFSYRIKLTLTIICLGVAIASITDLELNLVGTVIALLAVFVSSLYQVWVGGKQKEFDVDAWQLLHNQAPLSALGLVFLVPLFDNMGNLRQVQVTVALLWHIFLSILSAIALNLSTFMIIGRTSAVTYNVAGHLKTVLVLLFGFSIFHYPMVLKNLLGISITLIGVFMYSRIKLQEQDEVKQIPNA